MANWIYVPASSPGFVELHSLNLGNSNSSKSVNLGSAFDYNFTQAITLSIWVKLGSLGVYQRFFDNQLNPVYTGYQFGITSSDTVIFQIYNGVNSHILDQRSTETVTTGAWHHYAVTMDGTGTQAGTNMYRDGVLLTPSSNGNNLSGTTSNLGNMYIGQAPDGSSFLNGLWDEAAIFNVALSSGDITTIYNSGTPNDISGISGLVSWYRNETTLSPADSATTIYDRKGSNNGTGVNLVSGDFSTDVP